MNSSDLEIFRAPAGTIEPPGASVDLPGFVLLFLAYFDKVDGGPVIHLRKTDAALDSCGQFLPLD